MQEIEAALSRLPVEDLEALEKTICRLKHRGHDEAGFRSKRARPNCRWTSPGLLLYCGARQKKEHGIPMILQQGEKIHVIHRRHFDKDHHRHFIGTVEAYETGVARVTGYVYTVDFAKFAFVKRPELRTRLISVISGDLLVNVLPPAVNLDKVVYKQEKKAVRVTDGSTWYLDISEFAWL